MELIEQLMKHTACTHDTIHDLLRTPAMKKHLTPVARKFVLMGFDIRTKEQKAEDQRRENEYRRWTIRQLASRYDREKIYDEIWSEPIQRVAKRYDISDVGLAKVCKKLNIPRPGLVIGPKRQRASLFQNDLNFRHCVFEFELLSDCSSTMSRRRELTSSRSGYDQIVRRTSPYQECLFTASLSAVDNTHHESYSPLVLSFIRLRGTHLA